MKIKKQTLREKYLKEYQAWKSMKNRCYNPNYVNYHRYGGRGIYVCNRWKDSFENFLKDVGKAPSKKYQLDRKDNDGNYTPENCRWVTPKENCSNRKKYNNSTGYTGVFYRESKGRYEVNVCVNRKPLHVGVYYSLRDAVNARKDFVVSYNKKHGTKLKYEEFVE